jgi:hypothetical protein
VNDTSNTVPIKAVGESSKDIAASVLSAVVTVSDLIDHPSNPHSLVFFLRVPVRTIGDIESTTGLRDCSWEVELEFEFDLLTDDALSIVSEMKECEELSQVPMMMMFTQMNHNTRVSYKKNSTRKV